MDHAAPRLIADVAVLAGGGVLMVRYRDTDAYDGQTGWFLPDDFLVPGEDPNVAPSRILAEQVGFGDDGARLSHVESFVGGRSQAWHVIFHHVLRMDERPHVSPGPNILVFRWFDLAALPAPSAVAHHGWALETLQEITSASA